jgi:hypothetical protein
MSCYRSLFENLKETRSLSKSGPSLERVAHIRGRDIDRSMPGVPCFYLYFRTKVEALSDSPNSRLRSSSIVVLSSSSESLLVHFTRL